LILGLVRSLEKLNLHFEENSILTFGHFIASQQGLSRICCTGPWIILLKKNKYPS